MWQVAHAHGTRPSAQLDWLGHAGRQDYKALERAFWKSVTMNPPLYGADTPMSLFGSHCKGWALTDLGDLLKEKGVPEIPGVTTPMSYFGMWKVWSIAQQMF